MPRKKQNSIDLVSQNNKVTVKILADAPMFVPMYKSAGAAACDLIANIPTNDASHNFISVMPNQIETIDVGFSMELPEGWEAQIRVRSSLALQGLQVTNAPGTIDSDYRGRVKVIVNSVSKNIIRITHGDRFAQMLIKPVWQIDWIPVDVLNPTERNAGGFGSTGVKS